MKYGNANTTPLGIICSNLINVKIVLMTRAQIIHTHALAHSFPKIRQRFLPSKSHNVSIKPILAEPQSLRRSRSLLKLAACCHGCSTQLYGFLMQKKDCLVIHAPSSWDTTLSSLSNDEWTHSIYNICFISSSVYSISAVGVWCCLSSCHPDFMSNFKFIVKMYAVKNLFRLNFSYFLFLISILLIFFGGGGFFLS